MLAGALRAALIAAALLSLPLAAGSARAAERPLVAQIAQATPEPTPGAEPELSGQPPTELDGGDDSSGTGDGTAGSTGTDLPDTGTDPGLIALAGLSFLGLGLSLRLRLRDAA